jgi:hypothetical protein
MGKYARSKRDQAATLFDAGWSYSLIAKHLNVKLPTMKRWLRNLKRSRQTNSKAKRKTNKGNPHANRTDPPLSARDRKKIVAVLVNNPRRPLRKTSKALAREAHLTASPSTLSRIARENDLEAGHRPRKPALSANDEARRLEWGLANRGRDWSNVLAVDEIDVDLNGSPNLHNMVYWHKKGTPVPPIPTHKFPVSRHYLLGCSARGALDPIPVVGHPTAVQYQQTLDQHLVPAANRLFEGDVWCLYQDLASWHTADSTQDYCENNLPDFFRKQNTPPRSPDGNPQESINSEVQAAIAEAEPGNAEELETVFMRAYREATTPEKLANIFASMPARIEAIIAAKGGNTRY